MAKIPSEEENGYTFPWLSNEDYAKAIEQVRL